MWKSKPREIPSDSVQNICIYLFCVNREMELQLFFPSSLSNSCSTTDEEFSDADDDADEELVDSKSDSPRPSSISLFMTYRQFRDVLDLMDSSERLSPICEEPELENWLECVDASSPLIVPHPSAYSLRDSAKAFYTGVARKKEISASNPSIRTLTSGSSVFAKSSTCCFVWFKTILKWKSRRTKKLK